LRRFAAFFSHQEGKKERPEEDSFQSLQSASPLPAASAAQCAGEETRGQATH
jgi:hypothetical protein